VKICGRQAWKHLPANPVSVAYIKKRLLRDQTLTARDVELLQMLADGYNRKDAAKKYGISAHTIKHWASGRLLELLGADNIGHAIAQGFRNGLIK